MPSTDFDILGLCERIASFAGRASGTGCENKGRPLEAGTRSSAVARLLKIRFCLD